MPSFHWLVAAFDFYLFNRKHLMSLCIIIQSKAIIFILLHLPLSTKQEIIAHEHEIKHHEFENHELFDKGLLGDQIDEM